MSEVQPALTRNPQTTSSTVTSFIGLCLTVARRYDIDTVWYNIVKLIRLHLNLAILVRCTPRCGIYQLEGVIGYSARRSPTVLRYAVN